jgi:hypothetical protein
VLAFSLWPLLSLALALFAVFFLGGLAPLRFACWFAIIVVVEFGFLPWFLLLPRFSLAPPLWASLAPAFCLLALPLLPFALLRLRARLLGLLLAARLGSILPPGRLWVLVFPFSLPPLSAPVALLLRGVPWLVSLPLFRVVVCGFLSSRLLARLAWFPPLPPPLASVAWVLVPGLLWLSPPALAALACCGAPPVLPRPLPGAFLPLPGLPVGGCSFLPRFRCSCPCSSAFGPLFGAAFSLLWGVSPPARIASRYAIIKV